ncbi:hypothetical protein DPMN_141167 [Dreissena polymorpha]|uniref:Uncharacterized protein n=1 Tax=Dreissena polymorpha TaxID=45954 RepID=A0A9D4GBU2_DREPO|nr:hypothetical protein DPMN_141167 [Dreissena polymorpha]
MNIGHKIFKLDQGIIATNLLTKFHEDRPRNFSLKPNKENCPAHWLPCFSMDRNHFELNQHIIKTNILTNYVVFDPARPCFELNQEFIGTKLLTKFHENQTRNVASRVFTNKCGWTDEQTTDKDQ